MLTALRELLGLSSATPVAPAALAKRGRPASATVMERESEIVRLRTEEDLSAVSIAARLKMQSVTVGNVLKKYSLNGSTGKIERRNAQIIADRENRLSLREVGAKHGITWERVRQILAKAGREDLFEVNVPRGRPGLQVECKCHNCGKSEMKIPSMAAKYTYCSRACRDAGKSPFPWAMVDEAIKMRVENSLSYPEIAAHFKVSIMTCYRKMVTRAREKGIELPRHSRYFVRGRK